jgi:hypothetical protein
MRRMKADDVTDERRHATRSFRHWREDGRMIPETRFASSSDGYLAY